MRSIASHYGPRALTHGEEFRIMQPTDPVQTQILDYLYGLLDAQEAIELEARIQSDLKLRAVYEQLVAWQRQVAEAAKLEFAEVRFAAPKSNTPVKSQVKDVLHMEPKRKTMASVGTRWAIAAGLLLAVSGVILPLTQKSVSYTHLTLPTNREV